MVAEGVQICTVSIKIKLKIQSYEDNWGKKRLLSAVVLFESHKFSAVETCHVQFISVI